MNKARSIFYLVALLLFGCVNVPTKKPNANDMESVLDLVSQYVLATNYGVFDPRLMATDTYDKGSYRLYKRNWCVRDNSDRDIIKNELVGLLKKHCTTKGGHYGGNWCEVNNRAAYYVSINLVGGCTGGGGLSAEVKEPKNKYFSISEEVEVGYKSNLEQEHVVRSETQYTTEKQGIDLPKTSYKKSTNLTYLENSENVDRKLNYQYVGPEFTLNGPVKYFEYTSFDTFKFNYDKKGRIINKISSNMDITDTYYYKNNKLFPYKMNESYKFQYDKFGNKTMIFTLGSNGSIDSKYISSYAKINLNDDNTYLQKRTPVIGVKDSPVYKGDAFYYYNKYGDLTKRVYEKVVLINLNKGFIDSDQTSIEKYAWTYFKNGTKKSVKTTNNGSILNYTEYYNDTSKESLKRYTWSKDFSIRNKEKDVGNIKFWKNYKKDKYNNWISRDECDIYNNDWLNPKNCNKKFRTIVYCLSPLVKTMHFSARL